MSDIQSSVTPDGVAEPSVPNVQPSQPDALPGEAGQRAQSVAPEGPTPVVAKDAGFGGALAAAREAQGIPAAEMAGRLRLHPRQLESLEHERLDELPSAPFVRGYVRSYAKELKIDPAPLLAALAERLPAPATLGLAAPTGLVMTEVRRAGVERASRFMVIGGTVAGLLILAIVGWIASTRMKPATVVAPAPSAASAPVPAAPAAAEAAPVTPPPTTAAVEPASPAAGAASGSTPMGGSPAAAGATAAAAPPESTAAPVPTAPIAAVPAVNGLRLQVSGKPSWIEVTDADGRAVFVGTLSSGAEQVLANVKPPLRLTIGNASTVTVTYRGKLVDLQPHIRANDLARLTLE